MKTLVEDSLTEYILNKELETLEENGAGFWRYLIRTE